MATAAVPAAAGFSAHTLPVFGSTMLHIESGGGDPIVFLHGNPTSHYLWRNVMPRLAGEGRLLAPDLIGMGGSGRPEIDYTVADHERFLDAWFDALALDRVTLVIHDWGSALGISWARRHPERVRGIAMMEAIVRAMEFSEWDPQLADVFRGFRTPDVGERMILEQNLFVEAVLPGAIIRKLSEEEMQAYRQPYPTPESRRAILAFPRQLPIGGEPASAMALMRENERWLASSEVPKLLLTFEPGILITPPVVNWCRQTFRHLEVEHVGAGIHYVQEDHPESIGDRVKAWRQRNGITG